MPISYAKLLTEIDQAHLRRKRMQVASGVGPIVRVQGRDVVNFASNDYLSLAQDEEVVNAFYEGVAKFGVGAGASALVCGYTDAHAQAEAALAEFVGAPKVLLFTNGYLANIGIFSALTDYIKWGLHDRLNHASLLDASRLIGLPTRRFRHLDLTHAETKLQKFKGVGSLVSERVFSMDGDVANIEKLATLAEAHNAIFIQDDAHGFGVFPSVIPDKSIYMATLGKAAGLEGAFVAGDAEFIELCVQKARSYIYTTALPTSVCVAILASLRSIASGKARQKLIENTAYFCEQAKAFGISISARGAIQPILLRGNKTVLSVARQLFLEGYLVGAIRYPTVPKGSSRLRITLNAGHDQGQIDGLLTSLKGALLCE